MIEEIVEDIKAELEITEGEKFNENLLRSKVRGAYRDVMASRKYPKHYTEAMIERDMQNWYSQIREIALYDFNQVGSEGQTQYSQDGVSIHYVDRNSLFYGIIPYAVRG